MIDLDENVKLVGGLGGSAVMLMAFRNLIRKLWRDSPGAEEKGRLDLMDRYKQERTEAIEAATAIRAEAKIDRDQLMALIERYRSDADAAKDREAELIGEVMALRREVQFLRARVEQLEKQ